MNTRHRTTVIGLVLALVSVPMVQAHTMTFEYDLPSGVMKGTPSVSTRPCAHEWHDWGGTSGISPVDDTLTAGATKGCRAVDPEEGGVVRIGVAHAVGESGGEEHRTWVVSADDTLPARPFLVVCASFDGSGCIGVTDEVQPRAEGCGTVALTFSHPVAASALQIWVYAVHLDEDTEEVCLASKGTITMTGYD